MNIYIYIISLLIIEYIIVNIYIFYTHTHMLNKYRSNYSHVWGIISLSSSINRSLSFIFNLC